MKNSFILGLVLSFSLSAQAVPEMSVKETINQVLIKLFATSDIKGRSIRSLFHPGQESWGKMYDQIERKVEASKIKDNSSPLYQQEFTTLVNGLQTSAISHEILVNGINSFAKREKMISGAKKSIHMMVWSVYDDLTGQIHSDWLIKKVKATPGLDVKIMVDGITALLPGHAAELDRMVTETNGQIQVVYWRTFRYRGNGNHRKIFIVDHEKVIMGGINIGDYYSHLNWQVPGWRDTDLYMEGEAAETAENLFARIWNDQVKENRLDVDTMNLIPVTATPGETKLTIVDHHPGSKIQKGDYNILLSYAKLINDAKTSIDIENAYFIFTPVIHTAIENALKRGVKVRVFTNSSQSVDEPIVSVPIQVSAQEVSRMGAEVYLRNGTTLHSKFMVIDNRIAVIGSDNLHPRSQRFEGEVYVVIFDSKVASEFSAVYETDIKEAIKITDPDQIIIQKTILSKLANLLFWNHL